MSNLRKSFTDFENAISNEYRIAECYYWIGYIYILNEKFDVACEFFLKSKNLRDEEAELALKEYCTNN